MKWHTPLNAVILAGLMAWTPVAAQAETLQPAAVAQPGAVAASAESFTLSAQDKFDIAQLDRREGETVQDLKRDPARAALLSVLYPGLGQLSIGNDPQRSLIIMGAGTAIIAGSIVGFGLLAGRPAEATTIGNLLIVGTLVGYHLWNIRDAYVQAAEYNMMLEDMNRSSWLDHVQIGMQRDTFSLSWSTNL